MKFFTRTKRPVTQSATKARPAPVERPAMAVPAKEIKAMPAGSTGTRSARPTVPGLTDSDLVNLYNVASTRSLSPGECLVPEGGATDGCYIVLEGSLELRATVNGAPLGLGVIGKGECFGPPDGGPPDRVPYGLSAREPTTTLALGASAFELLPTATQRVLDQLAASTAARRFDALALRHAGLASRDADLVSRVKALTPRANQALASPVLRQALLKIPALPVYAGDIAMKLLDERTHGDEVVESIKNNPSLASLVLKRVNSAHYGLAREVSDYYRAVLLLGTNAVYQLILESAVESVISDLPGADEIQARAYLTSLLAYEIAGASGKVNPLAASTVGLLHNIGDSLALLIRKNGPEVAALVDSVDSPALGAAVLAAWRLPERVHRVVERQDQPGFLLPAELDAHAAEIGVLYVARACHDVLLGRGAPMANVSAYMAWLGLGETNLPSFCRNTIQPALARSAECLPVRVRTRLSRGAARVAEGPAAH